MTQPYVSASAEAGGDDSTNVERGKARPGRVRVSELTAYPDPSVDRRTPLGNCPPQWGQYASSAPNFPCVPQREKGG